MKMKKKKKLSAALAALCSLTCASSALTMTADADLGVALGQIDNIEGIGITDAAEILNHYARESAGLPGTLTDFISKASADVNGDDYVTIEDAAELLAYYAKDSAGMAVSTADFSVRKVEEAAYKAYEPIISAFLKKCKSQGLSPAYDYAYIDSNLIPELVLSPDTSHAAGACTIYTYADGKTILLGEDCFGYCGFVDYGLGDGRIITDDGYTGVRWVIVQQLEHGKLSIKQKIDFNYNTSTYSINGKSATESQAEAAAKDVQMATFSTGRGYTN